MESAVAFPSTFDFKEATSSNPLIKIINEGRGTSGYYTKEVLKRDGPKIFTPGTLMYINHATPAEEAQRPEGDWNKLAAVTTGKAFWDDNGKDGPALYAPAKVFSNYATQVAEKAPHTGVSIRASGSRDDKQIAPDGKPGVITGLDYAESIDLVTKAGRGGKLLTEAQVWLTEAAASAKEGDMTLEETQKAINDGIKAATAPLIERALKGDATVEANAVLEGLSLHADTKARIVKRVTESALPVTDGVLDVAKLRESIVAIAKEEGEYASKLSGSGRVFGMGTGSAPTLTEKAKPEEITARRLETAKRMGLSEAAAKVFVKGRVA